MSDNIEFPNADKSRACLIVGVSGYMTLVDAEIEPLTDRLRRLFDFLRNGVEGDPLKKMVADLVPSADDTRLRGAYEGALKRWTGVGRETPIVVLCNLAPGVDTLVANLVLDDFANDNVHLLCPLPFPAHAYCGATTFIRLNKDGEPLPGNLERQQAFLRILAEMGEIESEVVDLADGTKTLPAELDKALRAVSQEKLFPVLLKEDLGLDADELEQKFLRDRDSEQRDLRYYAAGEYLTVTSHLLVSVFDGQRDGSPSGTSTVVEARLSAPRRGLLRTTSAVPMHHGGPVWHLLANRPHSTPPDVETCAKTSEVNLPLPPLRILHPYRGKVRDCRQAKIIAAGQSANVELQRDRLRLFARIGESLNNFNSYPVTSGSDDTKEFHRTLRQPSGAEAEFAALLEAENPQMYKRLCSMSDISCRSSELSACFQRCVKWTLAFLFWITFFAAVSLHFLTHWHPQDHTAAQVVTDVTDAATADAESEHEAEHLHLVQFAAGWITMVLTLVAVGFFGWQYSRKLEAHGHDTRAIAEGLRVQFYWNLAGLGKSVSANYLSRHRSELDWIRGVIRGTSLPYPIWADWFNDLLPETKLRALRLVHKGWVQDQLGYFRRSSHREHHKLHVWHKLGAVAALAGVLVFLKLVSHESGHAVSTVLDLVLHIGVAVVALVVSVAVSWYLASREAVRSAVAGHDANPRTFPELVEQVANANKRANAKWDDTAKWNDTTRQRFGFRPVRAMLWIIEWLRSACGIGMEVFDVLVPSYHDSAITETTFLRRLRHGFFSFLAHLPLALAVACAIRGLCIFVADRFTTLPSETELSFIAGGVLLLAVALSVAWAEKNLHSELAYQYNIMAILFEAANDRLTEDLTGLQNAITDGDEKKQTRSISNIQALLSELGQEALDENAEWLLLHRSRPLEPVMAG